MNPWFGLTSANVKDHHEHRENAPGFGSSNFFFWAEERDLKDDNRTFGN